MRAFICTNLGKKLYKIVWINEDKNGVYVGLYGKEGGTHFSYHVDGTKHFKRAPDMKTPLLQSQGKAIKNISPFTQMLYQLIPFNEITLAHSGCEFKQDNRSTSAVFLEQRVLSDQKDIAIDVYLIRREEQHQFVEMAYKGSPRITNHQLVGFNTFRLENFPQYEVGVICFSVAS